jgi:hypothetical protein
VKLIWVLLIVLLLAGSPAATQVPDDALIVPGLRVGKWSLDMTVDDLVRVNGQGDFSTLSHPAHVAGLTVIAWRTSPLGALTKDRRKIEALSMAGGEFKTEKGIGVGSTRANIIAAYGNLPVTVAFNPTTSVLLYDETGTSFGVENDRVNRVWIFRSRAGAGIWDTRRQRRTVGPSPSPGERMDRY